MKPVTIAESENKKKKLEPTKPNWRGLSWSSCMIGTAAIPITALSAKLISMNRNSRATMSQAFLVVPVGRVLVATSGWRTVSRISALVRGEGWTLMGSSVPVAGTHPYLYTWVRMGTKTSCFLTHEKVRRVVGRKSHPGTHPRRRIRGVHRGRLCRYQHTRNREARQ